MLEAVKMNSVDKVKKKVLVDGFEIIPDLAKSKGAVLVDKRTGRKILDIGYSQFGSLPLGYNHPDMEDREYLKKLFTASKTRWALSDLYPEDYGDFVEAFSTVVPREYKHFFFIDGGGPAVENGLKVAFDWKSRKNGDPENKPGDMVIHFRFAFHGRGGYSLSLTNTADRNKYKYFPVFGWPRIHNPIGIFNRNGSVTYDEEERAKREIEEAVEKHGNRIAALIIEPIQGEGGDGYFNPEFFRYLRRCADENEFLLMYDEVQTGWATGKWWASDHITGGARPDIFSFGKKVQQCGIACNGRVDDVDNVFKVSSRINSTWGGTLADMIRSTKCIEVIRKRKLHDNILKRGEQVKKALMETDENDVLNIRGIGGWQAFSLKDSETRDRVWKEAYKQGCLVLKAGINTVRLRLNLAITKDEVETGMEILLRAIKKGCKESG